MKHFKIIIGLLFFAALFISCEKETIEENPEIIISETQELLSSPDGIIIPTPNTKSSFTPSDTNNKNAVPEGCAIIDFNGPPSDYISPNIYYEGITITYGPSGSVPNDINFISPGLQYPCDFVILPYPSSASYLIQFEDVVHKVTVSAGDSGGDQDEITLTAFSDINGENNLGDPVVSILNTSEAGCLELEIERTGIRSVEVSSAGSFPNSIYLGSISYCVSDSDNDGDGINDDIDNCPEDANADQADNDIDGIGDVCDYDDDNDSILDIDDNCPFIANTNQDDYDGDDLGDVCDEDIDGDGCGNDDDPNDNSNIEAIVDIDGCDSGVDNRVTSDCGITMSDMIDALEADTYKNHGAFIRTVAKLTKLWVDEGLISQLEKDAIMTCAGGASIP